MQSGIWAGYELKARVGVQVCGLCLYVRVRVRVSHFFELSLKDVKGSSMVLVRSQEMHPNQASDAMVRNSKITANVVHWNESWPFFGSSQKPRCIMSVYSAYE